MARNLARVVTIDALTPIENADAIEAAHVGGWVVVVKKNEFRAGDLAVYFEIDSFLPQGNPAWQFLVDKSSCEFEGQRGHVLRSIKLRGQVSQGLLLPVGVMAGAAMETSMLEPGLAVADALGVRKYERPIPACLAGLVRGPFPSCVPKTDQERIQNLSRDLARWQAEASSWEVTEKLEGSSCTFAWLDNELHVCSRNLNLTDTAGNSFWNVARMLNVHAKLSRFAPGRNLALQGELVGFGVEANIYGLRAQTFHLYDIYDVDARQYLRSTERRDLTEVLEIPHVPVIHPEFVLDAGGTMQQLIAMADGASQLKNSQLREGLVFKSLSDSVSFKAVSNKYLLKSKP